MPYYLINLEPFLILSVISLLISFKINNFKSRLFSLVTEFKCFIILVKINAMSLTSTCTCNFHSRCAWALYTWIWSVSSAKLNTLKCIIDLLTLFHQKNPTTYLYIPSLNKLLVKSTSWSICLLCTVCNQLHFD